jgi:hypothetical protein
MYNCPKHSVYASLGEAKCVRTAFLLTRCSDFYARHRFNKIHAAKNVFLFNIIA